MVKLGSLVSGVVDRVTPNAVMVYVNAKGYSMGTIFTDHLADHHGIYSFPGFDYWFIVLFDVHILHILFSGLAALMKSVLKPGYEFDQLLVLGVKNSTY